MKKKLLFTAVVVAAMSGVMVPVLALQNPVETEAGFMADKTGDAETSVYTNVSNEYVANASCTENYGWNKDPRNVSAGYNVNNKELYSDVYSGAGIEFWTNNGLNGGDLIYQDITAIPNGIYRLTAFAMGRNQGNGNVCDDGLYLFANEAETPVTTNVWGQFATTVEVKDNTLRIGLRVKDGNKNNWIAIANAVLEYQGEELDFYQKALQMKIDYVHTLGSQYEVNGDVPTQYSDELKSYQTATCETVSEYQAAIKKIDEDITAMINEVKNPFYVIYKSTEDYASNVLIDALETDENAKGTLRSAIASAKVKALASTDMAVWKEANMELENACRTYYAASSGIKSGIENFDVTRLLVKNAGFEDVENPVDGWNGLSAEDVVDGILVKNYDNWNQWDFSQTVDVPNGIYTMSAQLGISISDRHYLYLSSSYEYKESMFKWNGITDISQCASWVSDAEKDRWTISNVLVTDGKITMGAKYTKNNASGKMFFDNFRLIKVSDGANEIKALYEQKKAEADAIDKNILLNVFKESLDKALSMPVNTVDEYYTAYNAMKKAVDDARNSMQATSTIVNLINECQLYHDNSNASDDAKQVLLDMIEESKKYKESTTVEDLQEYVEPLETARREFVEQAVPIGEVKFDITYMLTNPDLSVLPSWSKQDGWYTDTDKGIQCMHNSEVASSDGKDAFYEIYAGNNTPMPSGDILYQKLVLKPGVYRMTAYAYGKGVNGGYSGNFSGNFFAGETKGDAVAAQNLTEGGVNFSLLTEEEIKLGLYSDGTGKANWAGIGYMKLYKLAPETLNLNETDENYNVENDTYTNVTVNRVLKADGKWNTFCVPFTMTADQLAENKIIEVRKLESVTTDGESVVLNFSEPVTEIEAGVPYIVKAGEKVSQIIVNGAVVKAAEPQTLTVGNVMMQGNYASMTITGDKYFISDNKFYRAADKTITVNGFRAYITLSDAQAAGINKMFINVDGEVTAVDEAVENVSDELVNVYTVNGVCVKTGVKVSEALNGLQKGTYIVNGKKVIK